MKRYVKAVLGGVLAVVAAFGWMVTLFAAISVLRPRGGVIWGFDPTHPHPVLYVIVLLIFTAGFFLAFRAAYGSGSK